MIIFNKAEIKRYFEYHFRWQASGIFIIPIMYYMKHLDLPLWLSLVVIQFIGAVVFWKIDKWLFEHKIEG